MSCAPREEGSNIRRTRVASAELGGDLEGPSPSQVPIGRRIARFMSAARIATTTDLQEAFERQYISVYSDLDQYLANEEISDALSCLHF